MHNGYSHNNLYILDDDSMSHRDTLYIETHQQSSVPGLFWLVHRNTHKNSPKTNTFVNKVLDLLHVTPILEYTHMCARHFSKNCFLFFDSRPNLLVNPLPVHKT